MVSYSMVKHWKPIALGIVTTIVLAMSTCVPLMRGTRSVQPVAFGAADPSTKFDPRQSAALFIGISRFSHEDTVDVPYAVDDAIDLAYTFAIDRHVRLVPPRRVVLAISGSIDKPETKLRLEELESAGATVHRKPDASEILTLLQQQADLAGRDGIFIFSMATHGFAREGVPYVLAASSLFRYPETALSTARMIDLAGSSRARRSLVFIDACRERLTTGARGAGDAVLTAAPLLRRMARVQGQASFYAAAAGGVAFSDDEARNGVFTKAVIDGLHCNASAPRGVVTAATLQAYVEKSVHDWIKVHRDPTIGSATQAYLDGETADMPLAHCAALNEPPPFGTPVRVTAEGSVVTAFDRDDSRLWQRDLHKPVRTAIVADLDADGEGEVIAGTADQLVVLGSDGSQRWTAGGGNALLSFVAADLYRRHTQQVVALWRNDGMSRLALYDANGELLADYQQKAALDYVAVGRPTHRHAPKIVVAGGRSVLLFDPKKVGRGRPVWSSRAPAAITQVALTDVNDDQRIDITLATSRGDTVALDFDGDFIKRRR